MRTRGKGTNPRGRRILGNRVTVTFFFQHDEDVFLRLYQQKALLSLPAGGCACAANAPSLRSRVGSTTFRRSGWKLRSREMASSGASGRRGRCRPGDILPPGHRCRPRGAMRSFALGSPRCLTLHYRICMPLAYLQGGDLDIGCRRLRLYSWLAVLRSRRQRCIRSSLS